MGGALVTAATADVGVLAAGPLLTGLAGLGAGAAAGGLAGVLVGLGIPEAEAKLYAKEITDKDAILIGVEVMDSDRDMVRSIMSKIDPERAAPPELCRPEIDTPRRLKDTAAWYRRKAGASYFSVPGQRGSVVIDAR